MIAWQRPAARESLYMTRKPKCLSPKKRKWQHERGLCLVSCDIFRSVSRTVKPLTLRLIRSGTRLGCFTARKPQPLEVVLSNSMRVYGCNSPGVAALMRRVRDLLESFVTHLSKRIKSQNRLGKPLSELYGKKALIDSQDFLKSLSKSKGSR